MTQLQHFNQRDVSITVEQKQSDQKHKFITKETNDNNIQFENNSMNNHNNNNSNHNNNINIGNNNNNNINNNNNNNNNKLKSNLKILVDQDIIDFNEIELHETLGEGQFGVIYRGTWRKKYPNKKNNNYTPAINSTNNNYQPTKVAVKTFKNENYTEEQYHQFLKDFNAELGVCVCVCVLYPFLCIFCVFFLECVCVCVCVCMSPV